MSETTPCRGRGHHWRATYQCMDCGALIDAPPAPVRPARDAEAGTDAMAQAAATLVLIAYKRGEGFSTDVLRWAERTAPKDANPSTLIRAALASRPADAGRGETVRMTRRALQVEAAAGVLRGAGLNDWASLMEEVASDLRAGLSPAPSAGAGTPPPEP